MRRQRLPSLAVVSAAVVLVATLGGACKTSEPKTKVVVPSAATTAPEYDSDGSVPEQRYVIRMSDGERDWEVQFPAVATGYEMHIPLEAKGSKEPADALEWPSENLTEADKELLEHLRRRNRQTEREGVYVDGEHVNQGEKKEESGEGSGESKAKTAKSGVGTGESKEKAQKKQSKGAKAAPYRPSYLLGLEEVRRLYKAGKYELAMVRVKKLEEAYPGDAKILSMKGTLWLKLGKEELAREAWERVLQIDPDNQQVIEALKRLNKSE